MSANTVISVKEIPVLGEKRFEHVSKATIIRWIEELNQIRRAHPDIDTKLCILTQAVRPGVLKMMRLTLVKAADNFVEITYPANVSTTSITAAAIAARQAFHDKWLDALRKLCSVEDQTAIIVKIQNVKLSPWTNGGRLTLENVMYWASNLAKLFEDEAQAIEKVNGKEVLSAVKRGMPIEVRQVVETQNPLILLIEIRGNPWSKELQKLFAPMTLSSLQCVLSKARRISGIRQDPAKTKIRTKELEAKEIVAAKAKGKATAKGRSDQRMKKQNKTEMRSSRRFNASSAARWGITQTSAQRMIQRQQETLPQLASSKSHSRRSQKAKARARARAKTGRTLPRRPLEGARAILKKS